MTWCKIFIIFQTVVSYKCLIMSSDEIKNQIILSTINVIERSGIKNATVRKIVEEAGVNIAAINYHFGSKDRLINETLRSTLMEMKKDTLAILEYGFKSEKEMLFSLFTYYLEGAIRYPNIIKGHFYGSFVDNELNSPSFNMLNELFDSISIVLGSKRKIEVEIQIKLRAAISSIMFIGIFPEILGPSSKEELKKPEFRNKIIDQFINNF